MCTTVALVGACGDDGGDDGDDGNDGGNEVTAIPIADARAQPEGTEVTVEGFVTVAPGIFESATFEKGFAIQDGEVGVYISTTELASVTLDQR
ncbi:MAG: hypothetical protein AAGC55_19240, partial [Myxococcota bacterium]